MYCSIITYLIAREAAWYPSPIRLTNRDIIRNRKRWVCAAVSYRIANFKD